MNSASLEFCELFFLQLSTIILSLEFLMSFHSSHTQINIQPKTQMNCSASFYSSSSVASSSLSTVLYKFQTFQLSQTPVSFPSDHWRLPLPTSWHHHECLLAEIWGLSLLIKVHCSLFSTIWIQSSLIICPVRSRFWIVVPIPNRTSDTAE